MEIVGIEGIRGDAGGFQIDLHVARYLSRDFVPGIQQIWVVGVGLTCFFRSIVEIPYPI